MSGSSGFIGRPLFSFLKSEGQIVVPLVRSKVVSNAISWDPATGTFDKEALEGFDAFIHLAGENIANGRWTKKKKEKLFQSRCRDTWFLSRALSHLKSPPKTVIAASALGFYGDRGDELLTEDSPKGEGFLPDLCEKWEEATDVLEAIPKPAENFTFDNASATDLQQAKLVSKQPMCKHMGDADSCKDGDAGAVKSEVFSRFRYKRVRVVHARFGSVLSPQGGMLAKLLPLYKLGLGGRLGSGKQFISWIALEDLIGILYHVLLLPQIVGPLNVVSPHAIRQEEFAKLLAKKLHRPAFVHLPAFLLKLMLGEMADALLLASRW